MPQPYQLEYSLQFILIFVFYKIIKDSNKNFIFICSLIILIILFSYRSIFFVKKYIGMFNFVRYVVKKRFLLVFSMPIEEFETEEEALAFAKNQEAYCVKIFNELDLLLHEIISSMGNTYA